EHLGHPSPGGWGEPEVVENRKTPRAHQVTTCLVTPEGGLVDQGDTGATPGQHDRGCTAARPGADDHDVVACCGHCGLQGKRALEEVWSIGRHCMHVDPSRADPNRVARALFAGLPERYDRLAAWLSLGQDR